MTYTQCQLSKGNVTQTSWIPSGFSIIGRIVALRDDGVWDDGWKIVATWQTVDESHLPDSHAERKAHKLATGDVS